MSGQAGQSNEPLPDASQYTVGWICALHTEFTAARLFLDKSLGLPTQIGLHDNNAYATGIIHGHHVVIAAGPAGEYGTTTAATVARDMLSSFPNIRIGLMVGIGGGAPSPRNDIRLGDVVVATPADGTGGIFAFDIGKSVQDQAFQCTGYTNSSPPFLRTAMTKIRSLLNTGEADIDTIIHETLKNKNQRVKKMLARPSPSKDVLFNASYLHRDDRINDGATCCVPDEDNVVERALERPSGEETSTEVHHGLIASSNRLMKDALERDRLARNHNVMCFETEAAGLVNHFPCVVIRGICDYSDTHKNDLWHNFAATSASAYATLLLKHVNFDIVRQQSRLVDQIDKGQFPMP
ncbi:Hypothetical protein D9617_22g066500 [Elsinoe fawcettii]|nr:Hypothetical protein D9617_22g066500 [Elsinoe fawcettii]